MSFEEFVNETNRLADADGAVRSDGLYCEPAAWRGMYDDGMSPAEAWREERAAASALA